MPKKKWGKVILTRVNKFGNWPNKVIKCIAITYNNDR